MLRKTQCGGATQSSMGEALGLAFSSAELASIKHDSSVPLYVQVYHILKRHILSGLLPSHFKLPNEAAVGELLGVSRITVNYALSMLVSEKLVTRRRTTGTYIADVPSTSQSEASVYGFMGSTSDLHVHAGAIVLRQEKCRASATVLKDLGLARSPKFLQFVSFKVVSFSGYPIAYCETWLRSSLGRLPDEEFAYADLVEEFGVASTCISHVEQEISALAASPAAIRYLNLNVGDSVLSLTQRTCKSVDDVTSVSYSQFHPDRFEYRMHFDIGWPEKRAVFRP